jgi:hypothetical protein
MANYTKFRSINYYFFHRELSSVMNEVLKKQQTIKMKKQFFK